MRIQHNIWNYVLEFHTCCVKFAKFAGINGGVNPRNGGVNPRTGGVNPRNGGVNSRNHVGNMCQPWTTEIAWLIRV